MDDLFYHHSKFGDDFVLHVGRRQESLVFDFVTLLKW